MRGRFQKAMLLTALIAVPSSVQAGWVSQWTNIATQPNGERAAPQSSSMSIAGNRVRLEQPEAITLIDYNTGTFTVMNPAKQVFWSGPIDEYARLVAESRTNAMLKKFNEFQDKKNAAHGLPPATPGLKKIDPAKLPPLSIVKTDVTERIAGYDTIKYQVQVDGELFQELWIAPTLDVSPDLNIDRYLTQQRKIGAGMAGKSADQYNALYLSDDYRQLLEKAFVLKMVTHHIAGGFERTATSVNQADVAASQFEVPDAYRKVRLSDVLPSPPTQTQPPAKPKGS